MTRPVCVVTGVGPGNGAAIARKFGAEGYAVALLARSTGYSAGLAKELHDARAYACDVGDPVAVARTFDAIRREMGDPEVLVYNAGSGTWGNVEETRIEDFEAAWRVNALGGLVTSQQVIPGMKRAGKGAIVFIGATASRRGNIKTAAFAPAKAAQRSLAESMARHLWPQGIHVSLVIVDGMVLRPGILERFPGKTEDAFVRPEAVAETAFHLARQDRSAWSFEVEARPFAETW